MFGSKSKGTLVATLAWAGLCWGQTPVQPSSVGMGTERIITVQEDGKETHQCKVTAEVIESDGTHSLEVEDLRTGERFNLTDGDQPASPGQELPASPIGKINTSDHIDPIATAPKKGPENQQPELIQVSGSETVPSSSTAGSVMPVSATLPPENASSQGSTSDTIIQTIPISNETVPTQPKKKGGFLTHIFHRSKSAKTDISPRVPASDPNVTAGNAPTPTAEGSASRVAPLNNSSYGPAVIQAPLSPTVNPAQATDWHQSWGKADDHSPSKSAGQTTVKTGNKVPNTPAKADDSTWIIPPEEKASGTASTNANPWIAENKPTIVPTSQFQSATLAVQPSPPTRANQANSSLPAPPIKTEPAATKSPGPDLAGVDLPQADTSRPDPLKDMEIIGHVPDKKEKANGVNTPPMSDDKPASGVKSSNSPGPFSGLPANPGNYSTWVTNAFSSAIPPQPGQTPAAFSGMQNAPPSSMAARQANYSPGPGLIGQGTTVPSYVPMNIGAYQAGVSMPPGQRISQVGYNPVRSNQDLMAGGLPNTPEGLVAMLSNALFPSQREWAAQHLAELGNNPFVVNALKQAAREDAAATVRASCVRGLVHVETDRNALKATLDSLKNDPSPAVQQEVTEAKSQLEGKWTNSRDLIPARPK